MPIVRYSHSGWTSVRDVVVQETSLTIYVNDSEVVTLLCSPFDLRHLVLGYLGSMMLLRRKEDVRALVLDEEKGRAWVETAEDVDVPSRLLVARIVGSGCESGAAFDAVRPVAGNRNESTLQLDAADALRLSRELQTRSDVYRSTGGVHSAALCTRSEILLFSEDIGRHNAVDRLFGRCFESDIRTHDKVLLTSGRITSEIVLKSARQEVPIIISRSAPTGRAIELADTAGVTVVGFARGARMNVYTHFERIEGIQLTGRRTET